MKKYLFLFLTLVVTSLAFVSCSDDDDDNQYNSAIVGTWKGNYSAITLHH